MTRPRLPTRALACAQESNPLLPSAPTMTTVSPGRAELANLRGRAGDVEHRERDAFVDVAGKPSPECALEENRLSANPDAAGCDVDALDALDLQRRERQRDERRDPISRLRAGSFAQRFADLENAADEHSSAAGDRIVLLSSLAHGLDDVFADPLRVEAARVGDLLEGGRIDVERFDLAEHFVRSCNRRVIDAPRILRHRARRIEHAMGAQRMTGGTQRGVHR